MVEEIVSFRVGSDVKRKMKIHDEINWSSVLRKAIIHRLERERAFNTEVARLAGEKIKRMGKSGIFSGGKAGVEIIREWRNKRK